MAASFFFVNLINMLQRNYVFWAIFGLAPKTFVVKNYLSRAIHVFLFYFTIRCPYQKTIRKLQPNIPAIVPTEI